MPFQIVRNDITRMEVDAIVNAANSSLLGGGGVDGAIHAAAGPELLEECRTLNGCATGDAKITNGYRLPAKYVIHTVGPVWHGGKRGEEKQLRSCYARCLEIADEHGCESLAFPMISAGAYGYPKDQAMTVAVEEISRFLAEHEMLVYLVVFGRESFVTGTRLFRDVQAYIDDGYAERRTQKRVESRRGELWRRNPEEALKYDMELADAAHDQGSAYGSRDYRQAAYEAPGAGAAMPQADWNELLKRTDESFAHALFRLIDERGMTDVECYKKANVDRKLFSKIRSNTAYKPGKPTVCAFAMALELSLQDARDLIAKAGFSLTHSNRFDIIIEYFLKRRFYDVMKINEILFEYDLPLLGSVVA